MVIFGLGTDLWTLDDMHINIVLIVSCRTLSQTLLRLHARTRLTKEQLLAVLHCRVRLCYRVNSHQDLDSSPLPQDLPGPSVPQACLRAYGRHGTFLRGICHHPPDLLRTLRLHVDEVG